MLEDIENDKLCRTSNDNEKNLKQGIIKYNKKNYIKFNEVAVSTPTGEILINNMNF